MARVMIAWLMLGCGSGPEAPVPAPVPTAIPAPAPAPSPAIPALAEAPRYCFHEPSEHEVPSAFGSLGVRSAQTVEIVGDPRLLAARVGPAGLVLERRDRSDAVRWSVALGPATGAPVVASRIDGGGIDDVLVAAPTGSGYLLVARRVADGAAAWTTTTAPAAGVETVQLEVLGAHIRVHARAASGDFVDVLDAADGRLVGRAPIDRALSRVPLHAPEGASRALPDAISTRCGASRCTIAIGGRDVETLDDPCVRAVGVTSGDRAFVAIHCPGSSGAEVRAFDLVGGTELWRTVPYGIGSVGHSRYASDVAIALDGPHLRVWGVESAGDFVSTLDPTTGRELSAIVARR